MAVSLDDVRASLGRRVALRTAHGEFVGRIAQASIPANAVTIVFASESSPGEPLVVDVADVEAIAER